MKRILELSKADTLPSIEAVLKAQGLPKAARAETRFIDLANEALSIYAELADPRGMIAEISKEDFVGIFQGEGENDSEAPLGNIYGKSDSLAIFAVTIGQKVCDRITRLFEHNDLAMGTMLDCAASEAAELAAEAVERVYRESLAHSETTMRFSPGYCGWPISAQKKLFEYLIPGELGVHLNSSYLMTPLKSISGVIVSGNKDIFVFDDLFDFCVECKDHTCQDRIRLLIQGN